jgi:hypothetical protein
MSQSMQRSWQRCWVVLSFRRKKCIIAMGEGTITALTTLSCGLEDGNRQELESAISWPRQ